MEFCGVDVVELSFVEFCGVDVVGEGCTSDCWFKGGFRFLHFYSSTVLLMRGVVEGLH